jgi:DNA-binding NarL/FixJ family response regulator|uniref:TctD transcriptional regulator n=1 Tax=Thorea hispida TaxID=202687 RepID=A0A1C9CAP2_9FLOR|nr:hypothetical protein Thor_143 [Thorea hispida]AOM65435.1 hypothetical protein Thor_143 [Thorea hispida]ARX95804.1 hypothetical protein [Thorea hispida]
MIYQNFLLVDDDDSLRKSLGLYLHDHGFNVKSVHNVDNAKSYLELYCPNLIILDIMMPDLDGYQLIQFLKSNIKYSKIPFIFLTAKGMTQDRIVGYDLGCHAYITKPFDMQELLAIIKSVLNNSSNWLQQQLLNASSINDKLLSNKFTVREYSILQLVLKGMTNKAIAKSLTLSLRNVEKYVSRLLVKTHSRNRTELVHRFFLKNNYIEQGE